MTSSPKGKAEGSDGVLGKYLAAISAEQLGELLRLLTATMQGTLPMPPSWRKADVSLMPKVAGALLAKQYRPIMVLPGLQKLGLKVWLHASMPFLDLRQKGSHGCRPAFQAAELQVIVRMFFEKRRAWGLPTFLAKLDIAKDYDTVSWEAIHWLFERRGLPHQLRCMYWRMHLGRTLTLRAAGGSIAFDTIPVRGMPQGAPESSAVYACLMEEITVMAAAALEARDIPAGLLVPTPESERTPFDVDLLQPGARIHRPAVFSCNFADDTYLLAASAGQISYMVTTFAIPLSSAHQFLASEKRVVLADPGTEARMRVWDQDEMDMFIGTRRKPLERGPGAFGVSDSVVVLGSSISVENTATDALTHRHKCAWKAYAGIRPQLQMFEHPLCMRLQWLDVVVLLALLWGLEGIWLCRPERSRIRGFKRTVVARCIRFLSRPAEPCEQFFKRRERVRTKWICLATHGHLDQLQRYFFCLSTAMLCGYQTTTCSAMCYAGGATLGGGTTGTGTPSGEGEHGAGLPS